MELLSQTGRSKNWFSFCAFSYILRNNTSTIRYLIFGIPRDSIENVHLLQLAQIWKFTDQFSKYPGIRRCRHGMYAYIDWAYLWGVGAGGMAWLPETCFFRLDFQRRVREICKLLLEDLLWKRLQIPAHCFFINDILAVSWKHSEIQKLTADLTISSKLSTWVNKWRKIQTFYEKSMHMQEQKLIATCLSPEGCKRL